MTWNVLLPVKPRGQRKTRLAAHYDAAARDTLVERMLDHVVTILRQRGDITRIVVLSRDRPAPGSDWIEDRGAGLNRELEVAAAALPGADLLVMLPDLPLLVGSDVDALLAAARKTGAAIAPDRHGRGTNAIALTRKRTRTFLFGEDSRTAFSRAYADACLVCTAGLAQDCDHFQDVDAIKAATAL